MLEEKSDQARRDGADHEQPGKARVGVAGRDLAVANAAAEPSEDPQPFGEEEEEEDDCRGEMRRDEESQEVRLVLVEIPAEQLREDHGVAEARDREELGHALQETDDDRLEVGDQVSAGGEDHLAGRHRAGLARPGSEPREREAGEPEEDRGDPVLHVMVARRV